MEVSQDEQYMTHKTVDDTPSLTVRLQEKVDELGNLSKARKKDLEALDKLQLILPEKRAAHRSHAQRTHIERVLQKRTNEYSIQIEKAKRELRELKDQVTVETPVRNSSLNRHEMKQFPQVESQSKSDEQCLANDRSRKRAVAISLMPSLVDVYSDRNSLEYGKVFEELLKQLDNIQRNQNHYEQLLRSIKNHYENEYAYTHASDRRGLYKLQKLDHRLDELHDLHQGDMGELKQRIEQLSVSCLAEFEGINRYIDCVRERMANFDQQLAVIEQRIGPQKHLRDMLVGLSNIAVEFVKYLLFFISEMSEMFLDSCGGNRNRATLVLMAMVILFWLYLNFILRV